MSETYTEYKIREAHYVEQLEARVKKCAERIREELQKDPWWVRLWDRYEDRAMRAADRSEGRT